MAEEQTGTTDTFNIVCIKNIICRQLNSPFFFVENWPKNLNNLPNVFASSFYVYGKFKVMVRRLLFLVIVKQNSGFLLGMEKEQQSSVSSVIVVNLNLHPVQTRWLCNHIIKLLSLWL